MRYTHALPTLSLLLLAACGGPDRDAYAEGAPESERAPGAEATPEEPATVGGERTGYVRWDRDQSGDIDENEFRVWWDDRANSLNWSTTQRGELTPDEFYTGLANELDQDGDGRVSQQEWQMRTTRTWGDAQAPQWSEVDTDGDGYLSTDEARQSLQDTELFEQVDDNGDGTVTNEELGGWLREIFDENGDGVIDSSEWNNNWFESRN